MHTAPAGSAAWAPEHKRWPRDSTGMGGGRGWGPGVHATEVCEEERGQGRRKTRKRESKERRESRPPRERVV